MYARLNPPPPTLFSTGAKCVQVQQLAAAEAKVVAAEARAREAEEENKALKSKVWIGFRRSPPPK
jgi:hypothetical protein